MSFPGQGLLESLASLLEGLRQKPKLWVIHGPRGGNLWRGTAFNAEGRNNGPSSPRYAANLVTHGQRTALRPMGGLAPFPYSFSFRHDGSDASAQSSVDGPSGLTLWVLNGGPNGQNVVVLMNHRGSYVGSGGQHPFGNEILDIIGVNWRSGQKTYLNHQPIEPRNSDGTFDFDTPAFKPTNHGVLVEHVATGRSDNIVVVSSPGNEAKALYATNDNEQVVLRKFGLSSPVDSPRLITDTQRYHGELLPFRKSTDTAWSVDASAPVTLANDEILEVNLGSSDSVFGLGTASASTSSKLFIVLLSGGGNVLISGTNVDKDTSVHTVVSETINLNSLGVAYKYDHDNKQFVTESTARVNVDWRTAAASGDSDAYPFISTYRYKSEVFVDYHPTIQNKSGAPMQILVFRRGEPLHDKGAGTSWHVGVAWEKKAGSNTIRSAHTGEFGSRANVTSRDLVIYGPDLEMAAGNNITMGGFYNPLASDEPDTMLIMAKKFRGQPSGDGNDLVLGPDYGWSNFYIARTIKIHKVSGVWKTDTGVTSQDLPIEDIVVHINTSEVDIPALGNPYPNGLTVVGGARVACSWRGRMWFANFPSFTIENLTPTVNGLFWTSTTDDLPSWLEGRTFVYEGETYTVVRVHEELASNTAKIETTDFYSGSTASAKSAVVVADLNSVRSTLGMAIYNECSPAIYKDTIDNSADEIVAMEPDDDSLLIHCKSGDLYELLQLPEDLTITEQLTKPPTKIRKIASGVACAGNRQSAFTEYGKVFANSKALAIGNNPAHAQDFTSEDNQRYWEDNLNQQHGVNQRVAYDTPLGHLIVSNLMRQNPTYKGFAEEGLIINVREGATMSTIHPNVIRATNAVRIERNARPRSDVREGVVCIWANVATLGTGGLATATGPHALIYDSISNDWKAVALSDTFISFAASGAEPTAKHTSAIQRLDGRIWAHCGNATNGLRARVELTRSSTGAWSETQLSSSSNFSLTDFFAWAQSWDDRVVALGYSASGSPGMALYLWETDDLTSPGRQYFESTRYELGAAPFQSSGIIKSILVGPSGEYYLVGYAYTSATEATVTVRMIDPEKLQPRISDLTFDIDTKAVQMTGGKGPQQIGMNRHRELFMGYIASSGGTDYARLYRYKFPSQGYAGAGAPLVFGTSGATPIEVALPSGEVWTRMFIDHRGHTMFAVPYDAGSGRIATRLYVWGEPDTYLHTEDYERTDYHRRLHAIVSMGNHVGLLFQDTPTGGGDPVYLLFKSSGNIIDPGDTPVPDGYPTIDTTNASTYWNVIEKLAGVGGEVSALRIDDAQASMDQAGATEWLRMRGPQRV